MSQFAGFALYKCLVRNITGWGIRYITQIALFVIKKERFQVNPEVMELNRMICNQCNEKEYEKCRICKVYQLVNKIAEE
jgi:hypothetical protein